MMGTLYKTSEVRQKTVTRLLLSSSKNSYSSVTQLLVVVVGDGHRSVTCVACLKSLEKNTNGVAREFAKKQRTWRENTYYIKSLLIIICVFG